MVSERFSLYVDAMAAAINLHIHGMALTAYQELNLDPPPIEKRAEYVWQEARKIYAFKRYEEKLRQT